MPSFQCFIYVQKAGIAVGPSIYSLSIIEMNLNSDLPRSEDNEAGLPSKHC